jgi:hypothetical protein
MARLGGPKRDYSIALMSVDTPISGEYFEKYPDDAHENMVIRAFIGVQLSDVETWDLYMGLESVWKGGK